MKLDEFRVITSGLLVGMGMNPDVFLPPRLRGRETKQKETCMNANCDKPRNGKKLCCSAECFKEFKRQQNETSTN